MQRAPDQASRREPPPAATESWRARLGRRVSPGLMAGAALRAWLRVLRDNQFAVSPGHWGRAASVTLASLANSALGLAENIAFGRPVRRTEIPPPLFVVGYWRSGTTHLHNLLARDDRFAYPNLYHVLFPHHFLLTEAAGTRLLRGLVTTTRHQDNVRAGLGEPQEEELALAPLTGRSHILSLFFPRRADHYDRYVTLRDLGGPELAEWSAALRGFLQKLTYKYRRPLVLKSPGHMARIGLLLELFPNARFVHIRRHPFEVFQSNVSCARSVGSREALQPGDPAAFEERLLRLYPQVCDAYLAERHLIPEGRLHEVRFEDLEADPLGEMRRLYEALALPDFAVVEPALRGYVASLGGYERNRPAPLPAATRERIARDWAKYFEEFGYSAAPALSVA